MNKRDEAIEKVFEPWELSGQFDVVSTFKYPPGLVDDYEDVLVRAARMAESERAPMTLQILLEALPAGQYAREVKAETARRMRENPPPVRGRGLSFLQKLRSRACQAIPRHKP